MALAKFTQFDGATMARPSAAPLTVSSSASAIARVGGLLSWFAPDGTVESASPLSLQDRVQRDWRFNAAETGESPTLANLGSNLVFDFDGVNDAVDLITINGGGSAQVLPVGESYSIVAVANPDALNSNMAILGGVTGAANESRMQVTTQGALGVFHGASSAGSTIGKVSAGQVGIFAMSFDAEADTLAALVNGELGVNVQANPSALTNHTLQIGNYAASGVAQFDGKIGDVIVLDWALHRAENTARKNSLLSALATKWSVTLVV